MATIDAARAIGRGEELGSLEAGKKADLLLLNLEHSHLIPHQNLASAVVYQAQGFEVETVVCNGSVVLDGRSVRGLEDRYPSLREEAASAAAGVIERAGLEDIVNRGWATRSAQ
jgi:cytosine/adenosine deaminase-related metal-dependent hydrolase